MPTGRFTVAGYWTPRAKARNPSRVGDLDPIGCQDHIERIGSACRRPDSLSSTAIPSSSIGQASASPMAASSGTNCDVTTSYSGRCSFSHHYSLFLQNRSCRVWAWPSSGVADDRCFDIDGIRLMILQERTTAVTGPPPKKYVFKIRVIGGSGSPLGSATAYSSLPRRRNVLIEDPNSGFVSVVMWFPPSMTLSSPRPSAFRAAVTLLFTWSDSFPP